MPTRWLKNTKVFGGTYDFTKLIDLRRFDLQDGGEKSPFQIICDIDKTYLETNFESVLQMVRIAFEDASQKVTVRGASEVLLAARWGMGTPDQGDFPRPLHFVSASPPQMRSVLEEKLTLDGLDWNTDVFKNQAYNLRKGRMSQLRQHTAYKSASLMKIMQNAAPGTNFILIGDNAEFDAFVYIGAALFLEGRLSSRGYQKYLQLGGVETEVANDFLKFIQWEPKVRVAGILIRKAPGYGVATLAPITDPVFLFDNYFEAALRMMLMGLVDFQNLWPLTRDFHNRYGLKRRDLNVTLEQFKSVLEKEDQRHEVDRIQKRLWSDPDPAASGDNPFLPHDLRAYQKLTEPEILSLAAKWCQMIHNRGE